MIAPFISMPQIHVVTEIDTVLLILYYIGLLAGMTHDSTIHKHATNTCGH